MREWTLTYAWNNIQLGFHDRRFIDARFPKRHFFKSSNFQLKIIRKRMQQVSTLPCAVEGMFQILSHDLTLPSSIK